MQLNSVAFCPSSALLAADLTSQMLAFGYLYPAYECYKSVELNKPDIEQLRFWCQYWILVAGLTVCERFGDVFIGWIPMYGEAKLAFFVYLWFPKTKGTTYVYDSFVRPYVAKHETDIDRSLLELRARAGDLTLLYWQKASSYAQNRIFYVLQYIASQSTPTPKQPDQPQQDEAVTAPGSSEQPVENIQRSSPSSSASSSSTEQDKDTADETSSADSSKKEEPVSNELKTAPAQAVLMRSKSLSSNNEEQQVFTQIDDSIDNAQPPVEEGSRLTRARSRRARGAANFVKTGLK
ncbi:HVA22-like protein i [Striga asiatica]|uniref:HVA22-like protein n=1 Tax=Striga asiatica TaxID=4170 RepID=A0A5A7P4S8_STRAF|nr:HVA22-like protein i [Striga asiatica]